MPVSDDMKALFSSEDTEWGTPHDFFQKLNSIFEFNLDVCANIGNAKVPCFISKEEDALHLKWNYKGEDTVAWMNPPYGKGEDPCLSAVKCKKKACQKRGYHINSRIPGVDDWIYKAICEVCNVKLVVCLIPARTDAEWFQNVFSKASLICFVKGRLKFDGAKDTAPFPSVVAVFSATELSDGIYEEMTSIGNVIDPRDGQILVYSKTKITEASKGGSV